MKVTHHSTIRPDSSVGFPILMAIALVSFAGCDPSSPGATTKPSGPVVTLVANGQSVAPIILPEDALPAARKAAEDLAYHMELISGARPEIQFGFPEEIPASAIWIGIQPGLEEVFPGVDFEFEKPEEILMTARDGHVLLAGRDRWNPDHMEREIPKRGVVKGLQDEYGTANAVYAFLREQLGVVWLWPGEMGIVVDPQETIAIAPFETRYAPAFRARGDAFRFSRPGNTQGISHDWSRRQGLQLDSLELPGGHGFKDWWGRFHKTNPEFFALQPDGTRNALSAVSGPDRVKLCQSNPAVWDQVMADIADRIEKEPWITVFDVSANDGAGSGICVCEDCRAWDHPDAPRRIYSWKDHEEEGVYLSNRYFTFANIIAKKLKEAYPDKDYYVRDLAYHPTQTAPIGFDLEDNVLIMFVPRFPLCEDERRTAEKKDFETWRGRKVSQFVYRPNQWISAGAVGIPQVAPNKLIEEDWPFLMDIGMTGIWIDSNREHWAVFGPHIYLLGRLAWEPTADGRKLLDEYYQRGFGPAADSIRAYWELMENEFGSIPYRDNFLKISSSTFGPEVRAKAGALLDRAKQEAAQGPEIYQERVAFVRSGFDYNQRLYDLVHTADSKGQLNPKAFQELQQYLDALDETFPHAFNTPFVKRGLETRLGFKIAPDEE